ncbi:hypothetical protein D3C78_1902670 [compost metagenome]
MVSASPLRSSVMRMAMRSALAAPGAPQAIMMPATMKEKTKPSKPPPMLARMPTTFLARSPSCGL